MMIFVSNCDQQFENRPRLVIHVSNSDEEDEKPLTSSKLLGELQRLNTSYNPDAKSELDHLDGLTPRNSNSGGINQIEVANIFREVSMESQSEKVTSQYVEPEAFDESWNHPDPKQREFWRSAVRKEFKDMIARKVWRKGHRSDVPDNRRCVKCKWVFKIKRNGVFRARLVACGYSQIPGGGL